MSENNPSNETSNKPISESELTLLTEKHISYLQSLDKTRDRNSIGFYTNEHLKISALYWGTGALNLLNKISLHNKEETINFIKQCIQEGSYEEIDFTRGDEPYKFALGGELNYNCSFRITL